MTKTTSTLYHRREIDVRKCNGLVRATLILNTTMYLSRGLMWIFQLSCCLKTTEDTEASLRRTRKWLPKETLHPISAGFSPLNPDLGNGF